MASLLGVVEVGCRYRCVAEDDARSVYDVACRVRRMRGSRDGRKDHVETMWKKRDGRINFPSVATMWQRVFYLMALRPNTDLGIAVEGSHVLGDMGVICNQAMAKQSIDSATMICASA